LSLHLHLEILGLTPKTSLLKGLFGPKSQIWTLFMFIHFVLGIYFLVFGGLLYTNISLNEPIFFSFNWGSFFAINLDFVLCLRENRKSYR
jgi:hypothetical protein